MRSRLHTGFFLLLATLLLFLTAESFSQHKSTAGTKVLKEGNKIAIQTVPELNTLENNYKPYQQLSGSHTDGDRYVLGGSEIWSVTDAAAIANFTELNSDGTIPVVGWGLNNMRVSRYTEVNNTPQWDYQTAPNDPSVDVADNVTAMTRGTEFDILDNNTGNILYQNILPDTLYASYASISRDGNQAVFLAQSAGSGNTSVAYSVDLSGTPVVNWTREVPAAEIGNWVGANISVDGSTIVVNGRYHLYVLNSADGSLIWDHFVSNTESPAAISGDGSVIATADNSGFVQTWIYDSGNSEYYLLWQYRVPAGTYTNWASSVAVSADGSTIAAGTLMFLPSSSYDGTVVAFDTYGDGSPKWVYSGLGDMVDDVSLSDDGKVAAAATWGDFYNTSRTSLVVFDVATGDPTFTDVTTGSYFSVDLSPDGSRVMAGGKAVHAREFGNGGRASYSEINLGGGAISGTIDLTDTNDDSGVMVTAVGSVRSAVTDAAGTYTIANVPAGNYTVRAEKPGYNFGETGGVTVLEGSTTSGINFSLDPSGISAPVISASTGEVGVINLTWSLFALYPAYLQEIEKAKAVGDEYNDVNESENLSAKGNKAGVNGSAEMKILLVDSIYIFRSPVSGGPYDKIASVDAGQSGYTDTDVFPLKDYYYVAIIVTAAGQSNYSNEAFGQVNDSLFTFSFAAPQGSDPVIDGVLSAGEWDDAFKVDVSDVLGYSGSPAIPQGSVFMYFKFDDQNDMLYIAGEDFLNATLDDNEGFGLYFDDNHNKVFEPNDALPIYQEGNFWAYWHPSGADIKFREIFTNGAVGNTLTLTDGQVAFSDGSGHLQGEVAIPMGFMEGYQLQVYGPDKIVGLGAFLIERNAGAAIFHGWWPQTMNSVFDPNYFGNVNINVSLNAPPQVPGNIVVTRQGQDLLLTWDDPQLGLNNDPLPVPPQIRIIKNGQFFANIGPGVESIVDTNVGCMQWYEYTLQASIVINNDTLTGPVSQPTGAFACQDPVLTELKYDDGSWETFYVVDFTYDKNKFAVRFTPTYYPARVMRMKTIGNGSDAFDFTINQDSSGFPGRLISGPYRVSGTGTGTVKTFTTTVPGSQPPEIESGDFWVLINYLQDSPGAPGIGVDLDLPNAERGKFYLGSTGWQDFSFGDLMISAFIADTVTVVPVELTSFNAVEEGNNVKLSWTAATQLNNQGFEIQRKSEGLEFQTVGFIKGEGTTSEEKSYSYVDKNLQDGNYSYRLKQLDFNGAHAYSSILNVSIVLPRVYSLSQNYPNPFNPTTMIKYSLPEAQHVTLEIYNSLGEKIRTLVNSARDAGNHTVQWDGLNSSGRSTASGMYLYKITAGKFTSVKKMLLIR